MGRLPADKRREQLLDCAAGLFAQRGYARATTAELAKAAGVTEPIIYRHFSSKRDLYVALIERTASRTLEHWRERLEGADDPAERLRRLLGENPMVLPEGREPYRVLLQAITEVDDDEVREAAVKHFRNLHAFLAREIAGAQQGKKVGSRFSAELIAWTLIYVGLGYGVLSVLGVDHQGEDARGMHVQQMLERLLVGRGD
jgi:AcrR family transcriptional regulator